jgi:Outer membrane protein beta-barrel domain
MKRLVLAMFVALVVSASLPAQQAFLNLDRSAQPSFPAGPAGNSSAPAVSLFPSLAAPTVTLPASSFSAVSSAALPDAPAAPRAPQYGGGGDLGYRWHLATGYEYVHFESTAFSANLSGIHTALAYSVNDWFQLEGSIVAAFGGEIFGGEMTKFAMFTGGGRIQWDRSPRRWSPWAHVLVGGVHVNPQLARASKNGFALQAGGGVDWNLNPRLSFRGEADYVRTQLYSESQNNYQAGVGVVLHF